MYACVFFRACRHHSTKSAKWGHLIPFAPPPLSASGGQLPLLPPSSAAHGFNWIRHWPWIYIIAQRSTVHGHLQAASPRPNFRLEPFLLLHPPRRLYALTLFLGRLVSRITDRLKLNWFSKNGWKGLKFEILFLKFWKFEIAFRQKILNFSTLSASETALYMLILLNFSYIILEPSCMYILWFLSYQLKTFYLLMLFSMLLGPYSDCPRLRFNVLSIDFVRVTNWFYDYDYIDRIFAVTI